MSNTPPAPVARETLTKLDISEAIGNILSSSLANWNPVAVAYVDDSGKPRQSYRGSIQRLNGKQLALWARTADSGLVKAMAVNPSLALIYSDWTIPGPDGRVYLNIVGRGHIEADEGVRHMIYDNAPVGERNHDPERKGLAIVIDVEEVGGMMDGKYLNMRP